MTKMTYVDAINFAVEHIDNIDVIEKLQALKESLEKRASYKSNKPSKTQRENEGIMATILDDLAGFEEPVTVTELIANGAGLEGLTNQKVSALLRKLGEAGKVQKEVRGKKAVFFLA